MTEVQKQLCPDIYRRLLKATLKPGESAWAYGVEVRVWRDDPARRVNRWIAK